LRAEKLVKEKSEAEERTKEEAVKLIAAGQKELSVVEAKLQAEKEGKVQAQAQASAEKQAKVLA
jgi:hypothetical protein